MTKEITGYLTATNDTLLLSCEAGKYPDIRGMDVNGRTIVPLPHGLPEDPVAEMTRSELTDYLKYGHLYEGTLNVTIENGILTLHGGGDLRLVDVETSKVAKQIVTDMDDASGWLRQMVEMLNGPELRHTLHDVQSEEFRNEGAPETIEITIGLRQDGVCIKSSDEREVALEVQNGDLRLMAYEGRNGVDAPVIITIPEVGMITVGEDDYRKDLGEISAVSPGM